MKQRIESQAPRKLDRDGVEAGAPKISRTNNNATRELPPPSVVHPAAGEAPLPCPVELPLEFDGTSMPEAWLEELRRRATQPLVESDEYRLIIAECMAENEARQTLKASRYGISAAFLEPQHWAWLFALLVALLILFWLGREMVETASSLLASAAGA